MAVEERKLGEDLVWVSVDRHTGGATTEGLRIDGSTGIVKIPTTATVGSIVGSGATPAVTIGNAAQLGTSPSAAIVGTNVAVEVTVTSGSAPSAFVGSTPITLFTLTIPAGVYSAAPFCSVEPSNQLSAQLEAGGITGGTQATMVYYDRSASSATSLVFKAVSNGTPTLAGTSAYKFQVWMNG